MNKKVILLLISVLLLFSSCNMFVTNPNPLIGYYRISESEVSTAALFCLSIEENGYFILFQAGGLSSNESIIYEGVYDLSMSNFDFLNASGSLDLHVTSVHNAEGTAGLALSYAEGDNVNPFNFKWTLDKETGIAELELSSRNLYICDIPGTGYSISSREYERITGIDLTPDEETPENPDEELPDTPEEPGTDEPEETPDTPENPDEETPEDPSTDPDNPDTEDPDGDGSEEGNTDDGAGSEDQGGEGIDDTTDPSEPPETDSSEDTDTEIIA